MNRFVLVLVVVLVLANAPTGCDVEDENENDEEDEWVGSWRVRCIDRLSTFACAFGTLFWWASPRSSSNK